MLKPLVKNNNYKVLNDYFGRGCDYNNEAVVGRMLHWVWQIDEDVDIEAMKKEIMALDPIRITEVKIRPYSIAHKVCVRVV
jgi:hypothetical protein